VTAAQPVGLGVVGPGDVALRDYLPELGRLAGRAEVVAFASGDGVRAREAAALHSGAHAYAGYAPLLADSAVDAVLNLTPIGLHAEVTLAALQAGKHVYSEKPLAGGVAEARTLRDEAAARGLALVCAPCVMVFPQVVHAAGVLASGVIGTPSSVRGSAFGGAPPWEGYGSDPSPFFSVAGGPLVDMAVYPLAAIAGLIAPVRRVTALSSRTRDAFQVDDGPLAGLRVPVEVDDNWQLMLELEGGCLAFVEANFCADATASPELEIRGEAGTLALSLLDVSQPVRVFSDGEWHETQVPHARAAGPDHLLGVEQLVEAVAGGEVSLSADRAIHVLAVIEAARRSAAERRAVEIAHEEDIPA
jgi:predicted dehydrogenase